ncbi:hypothetical protein [Idiomarina abyssalis]|uniref:hypothetical protein n=1 Tax=Idiomarina abyssalis TaxID=86102 RepID=UPI003A8D7A21
MDSFKLECGLGSALNKLQDSEALHLYGLLKKLIQSKEQHVIINERQKLTRLARTNKFCFYLPQETVDDKTERYVEYRIDSGGLHPHDITDVRLIVQLNDWFYSPKEQASNSVYLTKNQLTELLLQEPLATDFIALQESDAQFDYTLSVILQQPLRLRWKDLSNGYQQSLNHLQRTFLSKIFQELFQLKTDFLKQNQASIWKSARADINTLSISEMEKDYSSILHGSLSKNELAQASLLYYLMLAPNDHTDLFLADIVKKIIKNKRLLLNSEVLTTAESALNSGRNTYQKSNDDPDEKDGYFKNTTRQELNRRYRDIHVFRFLKNTLSSHT